MKKGFTLIELMLVIIIVGVISAGAIISFTNIDKETSQIELEDKYKEIQRSATLYIDLNDSWLDQFVNRREMYVKLNELKTTNYINQNLTNPVTGNEIDINYLVKVFIDKDTTTSQEFVNTCIVDLISEDNYECIANSEGKPCVSYDECN